MQYVLTDTSAVRISESSGVIQNNGNYEILLSETEDFEESFVLHEKQEVSFSSQIYIKVRDPTPHSVKVNVVPFSLAGGIYESVEKIKMELPKKQDTENLFAVMKKYGVKIFHTNGGYLYLPDDWAVEFFIQSKTPITDFTESPAVHFMLVDSFDMAVSLSVSSALKTDEHPSECFCVGTVDADKYSYEPLNVSLLDGNKHYIAIMCQHFSKTVEEVEKDFCYLAVYVDLKLATAKTFELSYDNFQDFSTLIFGVDAFLDNPCVDNLVTFDEILVTKNLYHSHFKLLASWIRDNGFTSTITSLFGDWDLDGSIEYPHIAKMPETFNASDNTVLSYKNGVLTFYPNVSDETDP